MYSEAPEAEPEETEPRGRVRRWMQRAHDEWHELVERAQHGGEGGRLARWRDRIVGSLAESMAEQRTLWAMRRHESATMLVPSSLSPSRRGR